MKLPETLKLPTEFPTADAARSLAEVARQQKQWYWELRRVLQEAIEGIRGGKKKFDTGAGSGTTAPSLGTNAPTNGATPYMWVEVVAPDGTVCVMPLWKKS